MQLSKDKKERKEMPIARGVLDYFPHAIADVSNVSFVGNEQHNPGEELHWAREKSTDHADCIARHLIERGGKDDDGVRHTAKLAWRALALLQLEIEAEQMLHPTGIEVYLNANDTDKDFVSTEPRNSDTYMPNLLFDPAKCTFEEAQDFIKRYAEAKEGEMLEVDQLIFKNCTILNQEPVKRVYIAGPMRGYPYWNFPAFDGSRDYFISESWDVISPADIDREEWGGNPITDPEIYAKATKDVGNWDRNRLNDVIRRDVESILTSDAIAMLPGWEKSTGAVAEFFLARWSGAQVLDATTGLPFETLPDTSSILLAVLDYIEDGE